MMRHANARITLELYAQNTMPAKQELQAKLISKWDMVSAAGLEPATHALKGHCSTN
jgi:hypothetical protein